PGTRTEIERTARAPSGRKDLVRQSIGREPRGRAGTMRSSVDCAEGRARERRGRDDAPSDISRRSLSRLEWDRKRAGGRERREVGSEDRATSGHTVIHLGEAAYC